MSETRCRNVCTWEVGDSELRVSEKLQTDGMRDNEDLRVCVFDQLQAVFLQLLYAAWKCALKTALASSVKRVEQRLAQRPLEHLFYASSCGIGTESQRMR